MEGPDTKLASGKPKTAGEEEPHSALTREGYYALMWRQMKKSVRKQPEVTNCQLSTAFTQTPLSPLHPAKHSFLKQVA